MVAGFKGENLHTPADGEPCCLVVFKTLLPTELLGSISGSPQSKLTDGESINILACKANSNQSLFNFNSPHNHLIRYIPIEQINI